jgi:hypothetical protein
MFRENFIVILRNEAYIRSIKIRLGSPGALVEIKNFGPL